MQMFHCLAAAYSSGSPTLDKSQSAIEMDYVGETLDTFIYDTNGRGRLTANELALCLMQCIEVVLLLDNAMLIADAHLCNICVTGREAAIRLHFIDLERWNSDVHANPKNEDRVMHSNILAIMRNLWAETHMISSQHLQLAELVFQAFNDHYDAHDKQPHHVNVRDKLLQLSEALLAFFVGGRSSSNNISAMQCSAEMLHDGIEDTVSAWHRALWSSAAAHQRKKLRSAGDTDMCF